MEGDGTVVNFVSQQAIISQIWAETLNVENVKAEDDFFALGGDSIMVTIMAFKLEHAFDKMVNVDLVFDYPTLSEFTNALLTED